MNEYQIISKYYHESPRKQNRRIELLIKLNEYIVLEENYNKSFSKIALENGIERKTLYRYFKDKNDILSQLYAVNYLKFKKEFMIKIDGIKKEVKLSSLEHFYVILDMHLDNLISQANNKNSEKKFLDYIQETLKYNEFSIEVKTYLANEEPCYYCDIIKVLGEQGFILNTINPKEYAIVVEQMIETYFYTINIKQQINPNYQMINLQNLITIMKETILEKNKLD